MGDTPPNFVVLVEEEHFNGALAQDCMVVNRQAVNAREDFDELKV